MKRSVLDLLLAVTIMPAALDAAAHQISRGDLQIAHPHLEVDFDCPKAPVQAGVMLIANTGGLDEDLIGLSVAGLGPGYPVSAGSALRTQESPGQQGAAVHVPAKGATATDLGGARWMFKGTVHGLVEGGMVRGTLQFRRAGRIPVEFAVEAVHRPPGLSSPCGSGARTAAPEPNHHNS